MAMDKLHAALLTLLRSGLWEQDIDAMSCFPLNSDEWEQLFLLARQQTVTGLVLCGVQRLPDELMPSDKLLMRWVAAADAVERRNRLMNSVLAELVGLFHQGGITPVLQKGQGVAQLYAVPLLRECGDIDLYFCSEADFRRAAEIVANHGAVLNKEPDGSIFYRWRDIEVEHHSRLFDIHSPSRRRRAARLETEKGFDTINIGTKGSNMSIQVPSPLLNLLLLDLHILKHSLGWGIGLRQLCDMARACHIYNVDSGEMRQACVSLGLERWNPVLLSFLTTHLGLPYSRLPYAVSADASAEPLLDIVWRGGNFGYMLAARNQGASTVGRKARTALSFCRNMGFALRYAPSEALWIFLELLKGQVK